jgi:hypothetical protein
MFALSVQPGGAGVSACQPGHLIRQKGYPSFERRAMKIPRGIFQWVPTRSLAPICQRARPGDINLSLRIQPDVIVSNTDRPATVRYATRQR